MSLGSSPLEGSFEDKIKNISEYLKSNVINPAESEKDEILKNANAESEKIISSARAEADKIIAEAKAKAQSEEATLESALRIASKKSVDMLKSSIEKELLKQAIDAPVKESLSSDAIVKEIISDLLEKYLKSNFSGNTEIALSDSLKNKISDFAKSEITKLGAKGISISSSSVPSGIGFIIKDKKMMLDFSSEAITSLLADQLRPEIRKYLF